MKITPVAPVYKAVNPPRRAQFTIEIQRNRGGSQEGETAAFETLEGARQWADVMREHYGFRKVWINGIEYNG